MDGTQARALLGVSPDATTQDVRRAFRAAALRSHPDRGGPPDRFRRLVDARDVLLREARTAPAPGQDPFAERLRVPHRPRFSARDIERRAPSPASVEPTGADFDRILAELLAA